MVDAHRHHPGARRGERHLHRRVAGVLERDHGLAGLHEHPGQEVEGLLGARGDQHLAGLAHHCARDRHVAADGLAERAIAPVALGALEARRPALERAEGPGARGAESVRR
ncbi:MAG TPA: hypothetical protein VK698_39140 [Kofleriaceae bacterium]|nr:hypothetical protein [Kofleriaceae bacterium]